MELSSKEMESLLRPCAQHSLPIQNPFAKALLAGWPRVPFTLITELLSVRSHPTPKSPSVGVTPSVDTKPGVAYNLTLPSHQVGWSEARTPSMGQSVLERRLPICAPSGFPRSSKPRLCPPSVCAPVVTGRSRQLAGPQNRPPRLGPGPASATAALRRRPRRAVGGRKAWRRRRLSRLSSGPAPAGWRALPHACTICRTSAARSEAGRGGSRMCCVTRRRSFCPRGASSSMCTTRRAGC